MKLIAREVILQAVAAIAPLLGRVKRCDRDLHEQLRRALSSAALNLDEGAGHTDGNRTARYASAAGSAQEVRMALELAAAYGYVGRDEIAAPDALLDRFLALVWRLRHPRR